jgi:hypothetical protein
MAPLARDRQAIAVAAHSAMNCGCREAQTKRWENQNAGVIKPDGGETLGPRQRAGFLRGEFSTASIETVQI